MLSCSFLNQKKIRPPSNHMDFVGWIWAFKNPPPDWPENLLTSFDWYESLNNVRSKAVMCRHDSKKGLNEGFWVRYRHEPMQKYTVEWFRQNFRNLSPENSEYWQMEFFLKSVTTITKKSSLLLQSSTITLTVFDLKKIFKYFHRHAKTANCL